MSTFLQEFPSAAAGMENEKGAAVLGIEICQRLRFASLGPPTKDETVQVHSLDCIAKLCRWTLWSKQDRERRTARRHA